MKIKFLLAASFVAGQLLAGQHLFAQDSANATESAQESKDDKADAVKDFEFDEPVRLKADGKFIKTEQPGYAAPSFADMDGDGRIDLLVGQFAGGHVTIYKNDDKEGFSVGEKLKVDGEVAEIPGVW